MNNVIIGQKGSGKTYRLFEQADAVGGVIVGENPKNLRIIARTKGFDKIKGIIYIYCTCDVSPNADNPCR